MSKNGCGEGGYFFESKKYKQSVAMHSYLKGELP